MGQRGHQASGKEGIGHTSLRLRTAIVAMQALFHIYKSAEAQLRTYKSKVGSIAHNMDRTCAANLVSQTKSVVTAI
jgi:hypothetical protein